MLGTVGLIIALMGMAGVPPASAQSSDTWPSRPVKILIPFTPGGTADTLGRIAAQGLSDAFGQQFIPDNKPGAGGLIAAAEAAKAPPDGHTLVVSGIGGFIVASATSGNWPVDIVKDFTHIAYFGGPPTVLVVNPDVPAKTLKEFVDYAKARSGINYGSPSPGSHANLIAELFQQKAGVKLTHVPYKGASQALGDLVGGHIAVTSTALTSAAGVIAGGKVRPLAVTSAQRLRDFPDIPTYKEQGYPDLVAVTWFALSGPAGIPPDIVRKINAEVVKTFQKPEVRARLAREAIDPEPLDPAAFTEFFKSEAARWTPIAKSVGKEP
jgi:tripartite-type tricarboxylate transporter receptor subunit TctC